MVLAKRGFTLVELSIVLVIIGLLIGGILVAKSMIETVKVQMFVRQLGQFDAAVANFQTKYNGLPGDSKAMGCISVSGNVCDNGLIEDDKAANVTGMPLDYAGELANFWPDLQQSGMAELGGGTFASDVSAGFIMTGPHPTSPIISLGTNTGIVIFYVSKASGLFTFAGAGMNYYLVGNFTQTQAGLDTDVFPSFSGDSPQESIPAVDALAIDTKIDDGLPNTDYNTNAKVIDFGIESGLYSGDGGSCSVGVGGVYNVSSNNFCVLLIKMLSTNGMNQ